MKNDEGMKDKPKVLLLGNGCSLYDIVIPDAVGGLEHILVVI